MIKSATFKVKGMQRDLSASAFNPEYAYENKNIRIMPTDESTLLSIINEKGNKKSSITGVGDKIIGIPIGQQLINDELVIFTAGDDDYRYTDITPDVFDVPEIAPCDIITLDVESEDLDVSDLTVQSSDVNNISLRDCPYRLNIDVDSMLDDRIYKVWFNNGALNGQRLFRGQLGFNYKHPIEALSFYENEDIRKVYWVDGLNQPRVINVAAASSTINSWTANSFDFIKKLRLNEKVTIKRNLVASGTFAPGVLQYALTYFDKYGQESNIFYVSPLLYVSYNNRGASPEDKVGNSFDIRVDNIDLSYDYLRIYSIHRTSIDATPTVKRVIDLAKSTLPSTETISSYDGTSAMNKTIVYDSEWKSHILSSIPAKTYGSSSITWELDGGNYRRLELANTDYINLNYSSNYKLTITVYFQTNRIRVYKSGTGDMVLTSPRKRSVSYTDNGTAGDTIDPTELLYVGGEEAIFGTMAQKDNTLFLGDVSLGRKLISSTIRNFFRNKQITFSSRYRFSSPSPAKGYYPYDNQLKMTSHDIKTFKYLETYRFGLQFQHITGKWSEPIWVNDVKNTIPIQSSYNSVGGISMPFAYMSFSDKSIINELLNQGYIRVRPVVVFPSLSERECICQGILCPTVFNVSDRYGNSPFAQSSWFVRPNAPFDEYKAFHYKQSSEGEWSSDWADRDVSFIYSINSRAGVMSNNRITLTIHNTDDSIETVDMDMINKGAWAEFRHFRPIPSNNNRNAEIQCIWNPPSNPYVNDTASEADITAWVSQNAENFYIDQSILTFHSPDIEFDTNVRSIDTSGLKLRIVGIVPLTAFAADIDIQTSTPPTNFHNSSEMPAGFYKEPIGAENISMFGFRSLISGGFWFDELSDYKEGTVNSNHYTTGFVVYPWHRNGSLNNKKWATNGYRPSMLDKKKISNMKYSYNSFYFDTNHLWYPPNGISGVSVFDSNEVSLVRLPAPENSGMNDINYYGNVDKVITVSRVGDKKDGYPIMTTGVQNAETDAHKLFSSDYMQIDSTFTDQTTGTDPIRMKYKSTPHAVLALNYSSSGAQNVLPVMNDADILYGQEWSTWYINAVGGNLPSGQHFFWDKNKKVSAINQGIININMFNYNGSGSGYGPEYGWLYLAELYNDTVTNKFGGQTEEAFENNLWVPCGESVPLVSDDESVDYVQVEWVEGDTYYQRYDHLKTYPFTLEDQNAVTDIVSFMCETRVNIDGRYDRNRGQVSNFAVTPENFNLMNDVYSQQNNFFNYRSVNPNKLNLDHFSNAITWTKTKTAGELVDTWTNITLASTLDLDGDKGKVRALRRFNNELIAFQDKGISNILFNSRTQLSSVDGVPIEIANSGKVDGKRYLSDSIGCTNKWSICETPNGIYFIDDITKGIFLFNGKLDNLSDRLGFHSWINSKSDKIDIWNPVDFDGFVTYYDKVNGDIFFISKEDCLAFSEPLGQFTSFYSYEDTPYFSNLEDRGLFINTMRGGNTYRLWLHNEGDYNIFFGQYEPFYTTIIANPDMGSDKIFNNLEFRADSWKDGVLLNSTFDTLTAWNEYQSGTSTLNNIAGRPSDLKKKFRIWRANIPRSISNRRDRMRNPWLYLKLSMEKENTNKTLLHDMTVHYFE